MMKQNDIKSLITPTIIFLLALLLSACATQGQSSGNMSGEFRIEADDVFNHLAKEISEDIPGLTVSVGLENDIVYRNAFGLSNIETKQPVTARTRFRIYSTSKSIGAITAMILAESGELKLDAPISTYLPNIPKQLASITTRQIMAHHSGIRHYNSGEWLNVSDFNCSSPQEALPDFINDPLKFKPGTGFQYSTFAYALLAAIVESAADTPFDELMEERVFGPAGMKATAIEGRAIEGYETSKFYFQKDEENLEFVETIGVDSSCKYFGGGFVSTSEDLARLGLALINGKLLTESSLNEVWRLHTVANYEANVPPYGLGFFSGEHLVAVFGVAEEDYHESWMHGGASPGGFSVLIIYPKNKTVVAMTMNAKAGKSIPVAANSIALPFMRK